MSTPMSLSATSIHKHSLLLQSIDNSYYLDLNVVSCKTTLVAHAVDKNTSRHQNVESLHSTIKRTFS